MKLLKIDNGEALYKKKDGYSNIKNIDREDLLYLLSEVYKSASEVADDSIKLDDIKDPAERIIFENIFIKLNDFYNRRDSLEEEIGSEFGDAEKQYAKDLNDKA